MVVDSLDDGISLSHDGSIEELASGVNLQAQNLTISVHCGHNLIAIFVYCGLDGCEAVDECFVYLEQAGVDIA